MKPETKIAIIDGKATEVKVYDEKTSLLSVKQKEELKKINKKRRKRIRQKLRKAGKLAGKGQLIMNGFNTSKG